MVEKVFTQYLVEKEIEHRKPKGSIHLSFGQEAVDVGIIEAFKDYYILGNHRSHGQYLAKTGDIEGLLKQVCNGSSQHLYHDEFISHGIQGGLCGVALGLAPSVCFIGDGTLGQGIVYEAMGMAKENVIFVIIDNGYQMSKGREYQFYHTQNLAEYFDMDYLWINNCSDVQEIYEEIAKFRESINRPAIIHAKVKRLCGHSMNDTQAYRPKEEMTEEYYKKHSPVEFLKLKYPKIYDDTKARIESILAGITC